MNENVECVKFTNYNWHPLTKYIRQIYGDYCIYLDEDLKIGYISYNTYNEHIQKKDFKFWLTYNISFNLRHNKDYTLATIFKPLIITQYNSFCLFKYNNHLDFSELGYSFQDFFYLYDGLYQECRSVVFNLDNFSIILAPQAKFKNFGEEDEEEKLWSQSSIWYTINKNKHSYFITEKMDGSNQNFCYNTTLGFIFGSGSQALDTDESWRLNNGWKLFKSKTGYERLLKEFPDTTFMFEYVSPENPVVVKYTKEQEGLYLFAARDNFTGQEMNPVLLFHYADKYNVPHVNLYLEEDFNSILKKTKDYTCSEKEGWVVTVYNPSQYDNHVFKFKVKIDDYILMHKAITGIISPNNIIEIMAEEKIDDFYSKIPEAYRKVIFDIIEEISEYEKNMYCQTLEEYSKCMDYVNNYLVNHNYTEVCDTDDTKRRVIKIKFMEATEKFCKKETKSYCKAMFLNHFNFQNSSKTISMLHNGKDIEKGRSYKKIEEIRRWNKNHQKNKGVI